jgi:hypothetical protein
MGQLERDYSLFILIKPKMMSIYTSTILSLKWLKWLFLNRGETPNPLIIYMNGAKKKGSNGLM